MRSDKKNLVKNSWEGVRGGELGGGKIHVYFHCDIIKGEKVQVEGPVTNRSGSYLLSEVRDDQFSLVMRARETVVEWCGY